MRSNRRRGAGDRGAALLETALIAPVFFILVFGILDFGLLFRDAQSISDAASDGVRWASIQGPDPRQVEYPVGSGSSVSVSADYSVVRAVREGTASIDAEDIERIVVFRVDRNQLREGVDPVDLVPAACKTGGSSTSAGCNVYPANDAFLAVQTGNVAYFECDLGTENACGYDPALRNDGPNPWAIEYIGVYVKADHDYVTGLFGSSSSLESAKILRLEPGQVT
ncbi:MAG: pilus assembly protein [Acidimicrobiales bacterium]|jgi:hypothetical protein|nr:pilus assembly protein [Acidimicrobiales bacterium]